MIRNFSTKDYETIHSWYEAYNEYPTPLKHMPEETTFVIEEDGILVASLGYLMTNTEIAIIQNVIGNPKVNRTYRKLLVNKLFDFLYEHAKQNGFNLLIGFTFHEKLAKRYKDLNWITKSSVFIAKEI